MAIGVDSTVVLFDFTAVKGSTYNDNHNSLLLLCANNIGSRGYNIQLKQCGSQHYRGI